MTVPRIITGQNVDPAKLGQAKWLRRHQTRAEQVLWRRLRAGRLAGYHFRRQQVIAGFILDFYCHAVGLVVEVDGKVHSVQRVHDAERDRVLASHGLSVLRVSNDEVEHNLGRVLKLISTHVAIRLRSGRSVEQDFPSLRGGG